MTAKVKNVYQLLDSIKADIECTCQEESLSPLLFWLLVRQQADYELMLIQEPAE